ncbi:MAG TPA: 1-deoxy-D-xylulose-5-phosphate synthase [Bacteroidales bacterium]|jgi:1-deoxy-D-xylulose-5-phosphate synthase|nr:1-deoxy-D-xylulose-5-phosphate synthase [Bacteroidales bacterium]
MMDQYKVKLLDQIIYPADLRNFDKKKLPQICDELRQFIIEQCSSNPGHLGASLGVVELTVALHYVYDTPDDQLIWDVGHQAYGHKILTGRRQVFNTNRMYKGISGFPRMAESEYDAFGTGHSSTSISAALGMAVADRLQGIKRNIVAIIGDGSLTGGLAFEGLNNAGMEKTDLLVILNDNNIAIDPNTGALKEYLTDITTSRTYNRVKKELWSLFGKINKIAPHAREYAQKLENGLKSILMHQSNLFEALKFRYFGPIDGHDVLHLTELLEDMKNIPGPKLLHVLTVKGKGFPLAERNQTIYHAPGKFNPQTGALVHSGTDDSEPPLYQDVFGITLLELAKQNDKIVGITPAMPSGCSLKILMNEMPHRAFDVGIAEQHAVTFSAGLAAQGIIPYCNIYSSFLQRAYDQVIHDVALQKLPVIFCIDRGGIVGADGATHQGIFDIAYLRNIPNMIVSAPMDENDLRNLLYTAQLKDHGPFAIRYPRGRGRTTDWRKPFTEIKVGRARLLRPGKDIAVLTIGNTGNLALDALDRLEAENIEAEHWDMRFAKPLDTECLHGVFRNFKNVLTVEDGILAGGFGSSVIEFMIDNGYQSNVRRLGVPDTFVEHGSQTELYKECGFDSDSIYHTVKQMISRKVYSEAL